MITFILLLIVILFEVVCCIDPNLCKGKFITIYDVDGMSLVDSTLQYPQVGNYTSDEHVCWKLRTATNQKIEFQWNKLDIEDFLLCATAGCGLCTYLGGYGCSYDYLKIHNGNHTATLCGTDGLLPEYQPPYEGDIVIEFKTNSLVNRKGFSLSWKPCSNSKLITPDVDPEVCHSTYVHTYSNTTGVITYPLVWNDPYPSGDRKCWRIQCNGKVILEDWRIDMENSSGCHNDRISIFDSEGFESRICEIGSGTPDPSTYDYYPGDVVINFHTDNCEGGRGFEVTYRCDPWDYPKTPPSGGKSVTPIVDSLCGGAVEVFDLNLLPYLTTGPSNLLTNHCLLLMCKDGIIDLTWNNFYFPPRDNHGNCLDYVTVAQHNGRYPGPGPFCDTIPVAPIKEVGDVLIYTHRTGTNVVVSGYNISATCTTRIRPKKTPPAVVLPVVPYPKPFECSTATLLPKTETLTEMVATTTATEAAVVSSTQSVLQALVSVTLTVEKVETLTSTEVNNAVSTSTQSLPYDDVKVIDLTTQTLRAVEQEVTSNSTVDLLPDSELLNTFKSAASYTSLVASGSTTMAMRFLVVNGICSEKTTLLSSFTPTGIEINNSTELGAITAHVCIIMICLVLSKITATLIKLCYPKNSDLHRIISSHDPEGFLRFPSAPLFLFQWLYLGTGVAASILIVTSQSVVNVIVGSVTGIFLFIIPFKVLLILKNSIPAEASFEICTKSAGGTTSCTSHKSKSVRQFSLFIMGTGEWLSRNRENDFSHKYASVLRDYTPQCCWFSFIELISSFFLSITVALPTNGNDISCGHIRLAQSLIYFILAGCILYSRPYARKRNVLLTAAVNICCGVSLQLLACGFYTEGERSSVLFEWSAKVLKLAMVALTVKVLLDLIAEILILLSNRRSIMQTVFWSTNDINYSKFIKTETKDGFKFDPKAYLFDPMICVPATTGRGEFFFPPSDQRSIQTSVSNKSRSVSLYPPDDFPDFQNDFLDSEENL